MDEATHTSATVVDPCPGGHLELLEAIGARLEQCPDSWLDPWADRPEPVAPWQFTDKALLAELATVQRQLRFPPDRGGISYKE